MTQARLATLCREWQAILRLRDWNVAVVFSRMRQLDNYLGVCEHSLPTRTAVIHVAEDQDDPEETLVHELLHLHFAPFEEPQDGTPKDVTQEQAINLIAEALVKLRRSSGGRRG